MKPHCHMASASTPVSRDNNAQRWRPCAVWWPWLVAGAVAVVAFGAWWLWWRLPKRQVDRLRLTIRDPKARADVEDNFRKTIGQLLGGAAVLVGAGFAYLQFQQQQRSSHDVLISNQVAKGTRPASSTIFNWTPKTGRPCFNLTAVCALESRRRCFAFSAAVVPSGLISVIPQPWRRSIPCLGVGRSRAAQKPRPLKAAPLTLRRAAGVRWSSARR